MEVFFTADTHFGQSKIIKYCHRPFSDVNEMDRMLIRNWNMRVKTDDTVFVLGDFCFKNKSNEDEKKSSLLYQSQLNGNKIFIKGNHDKNNSTKTIIQSLTIKYGGYVINCVHDPIDADTNYTINFVGHIHNKWLIRQYKNSLLFNVGVDMHRFFPVKIDHILKMINKLQKTGNIETFIKTQPNNENL